MDANHNRIVTVTNGGSKPANALLTLHYDNGAKQYEMQQTIQPGDQMWVSFADLIHNRVPDHKGSVLPADVSSGTYDVESLTEPGELLPGSVGMDGTSGNKVWGQLATCCGIWDGSDGFDPDQADLYLGDTDLIFLDGTNACTNKLVLLNGDMSDWGSDDSGIAAMTAGQVQGISVGSTTGYASGYVWEGYGTNCAEVQIYPSLPVTVLSATISIQSSGTIPTANTARGEYESVTGTYSLGNITDVLTDSCFIGYQATGSLDPSTYTGTVTLVRTKQGSVYGGPIGETLLDSYPSGTDDTSAPAFEVTTPTNGSVYDLDAPGATPPEDQIGRERMNFYENAQLPDGTFVANEVGFYVRFSCIWESSGSTFLNQIQGDNVLGMGTTKTTWNLQ